MPRPRSKKELVVLSNKDYNKLLEMIRSFPEEKQHADFPEGTLNRNI
ncbi:ClbS/DfsB family four-helix bundle protein [Aquimarina gracilis]|uniref:ClbS/DfsB family four-helix bundle protein n=1 Tax=Aquimarina gracilis TaxID=874422 RepID=A0ABU5ZTX8_9FLAO|nr:ClbS/DfsB family four-helix bundle protein [Aquimarina gracilis]MEB3345002.1 ClbS/DfsB family four-helix bundle protein [Aquimarina gracilis]